MPSAILGEKFEAMTFRTNLVILGNGLHVDFAKMRNCSAICLFVSVERTVFICSPCQDLAFCAFAIAVKSAINYGNFEPRGYKLKRTDFPHFFFLGPYFDSNGI